MRGPRFAAVRARQNATEPSGHPGHGRPGRWLSVFSPSLRIPPSSHKNTLRRWHRLPGLRLHRPSFVGALSRAGAARGREAVCPPHKPPGFGGVWETSGSQPLHRQSPPAPHASRPPPGPTLRVAPGPLWFRDSGQRYRIKASDNFNLIPAPPSPPRDSKP